MPEALFEPAPRLTRTHSPLCCARGGAWGAPLPRQLLAEHLLELTVNCIPCARLVCTRSHLDELAAGYLLTEGLAPSPEDIAGIACSADGGRCSASLRRPVAAPRAHAREITSTGCARGALVQSVRPPLPRLERRAWDREWVFRLADRFEAGAPLYAATRGAHSCLLSIEGAFHCLREDIGRHNALDKAVDCAALAGLPLSRAVLYTSGRVPLDMVRKAIRCRVPVLASHAVPTAEAVELADRHGLVLIGQATSRGMTLFTSGA